MTEEKIEQLKHELGKFGVVEKCQEGFGEVFIRIIDFDPDNTIQCLQLITGLYPVIHTIQIRPGYLLVRAKLDELPARGKPAKQKAYTKTEKHGQRAIKPMPGKE